MVDLMNSVGRRYLKVFKRQGHKGTLGLDLMNLMLNHQGNGRRVWMLDLMNPVGWHILKFRQWEEGQERTQGKDLMDLQLKQHHQGGGVPMHPKDTHCLRLLKFDEDRQEGIHGMDFDEQY